MIGKRKTDDCRLTIFTPVYNRAYCIEKCYRSLLRQKNQNFIWIIVDDGSVDGLSGLAQSWMDKGSNFRIEYYRKENGGIHTAYNLALSHVHTDYWVCIDSDDWLADNAVNVIYEGIKYCEKHQLNVCGMVGLDAYGVEVPLQTPGGYQGCLPDCFFSAFPPDTGDTGREEF